MERDARPLPPKGHRLLADAAHEEINQGRVRWGLPVLLGLHTGLRRRLLVHYQDEWRKTTDSGDQIRVPKQIECPLRDEGCPYCNNDKSRGPDGFLRPKTGQGEQRVIPLPETWPDSWSGDTRETGLSSYLDNHFRYNDTWGYERQTLADAVHRVASRREEIGRVHEGMVERHVSGEKVIVPDVLVHDLRASWCTQCLRCGVDETTLMDWGGWSNSDMIQDYRGFVGDPGGTNRAMIEGERSNSSDSTDDVDVNMQAAYRVYSKLTDGQQVDPNAYTTDVLEAAYEMVQAEE